MAPFASASALFRSSMSQYALARRRKDSMFSGSSFSAAVKSVIARSASSLLQ